MLEILDFSVAEKDRDTNRPQILTYKILKLWFYHEAFDFGLTGFPQLLENLENLEVYDFPLQVMKWPGICSKKDQKSGILLCI